MSRIRLNLSEIIDSLDTKDTFSDNLQAFDNLIRNSSNDHLEIVCDIYLNEAMKDYIKWAHLEHGNPNKSVSFIYYGGLDND